MSMRTRARGCQTMVKEASQTTNFWPISFTTCFIMVNERIYLYNFSLLANFLQAGERSQRNNHALSLFHNTFYIG